MSTFEIIMAIINVAAIITVPIAAVFVGQKLQDRNQKRKDKMAIFQCLMTHRATGWAHQDTVNALNTIDIIFVDDESVRKCWADLFSKYKPNYSTQEITTAQCKLLEAMAETLGYEKKITWETIQNPYLPDGLVQRMEKTAKFEQGQLAMAEFMTNMAGKAMISQNLTRSQSDRLKASIKATYDESKPGTSLNKCIRFCYELKAGDIAVIVDNNRVAFAYIGEYYEEQSPTLTVELEKEVHQQIEKANPNTDTFTCPYIKRRKITLIKVLTADDTISPYLQSAIARNWHSLSDLNEYAELVLSGCFDTVLFKDKLTVTFRVKRKEEINVLDLANFVLCAARLLSDDKPETVQVKTTLHSPGDVILQIWNFAQENAFPLLICYMAIFGGKARDYEFHSIIGVIKGIINHKYDEDKKKIELRKLSAEADLAEQQALKQKLENIETMRRLQLSSVDAYAEPLATAAKNLAVQPSSATIIDITKILKSQQEDQPPQ